MQRDVGRGFTAGALTVLCTALSWAFLAGGALAVGPANTNAPAIPASAKEGVALTVTPGTWTPTPTVVTDQWMVCNPPNPCAAVGPANSPTYTPGPTDVGATIEVVESAGDGTPANTSTAPSNQTSAVAPLSPPVNSVAPTITGVFAQGQTLTASPGTWSDSAQATYAYQWSSCLGASCNIVGTQSPQYQTAPGDAGRTIKVQVTATNDGGSNTTPVFSAATPTIVGPPANTTPPGITGTLQQGRTLTETPGVWTYTPSVGIQWQRCDSTGNIASCTPIPGATGQTYTLNAFDTGFTIRVQETASNAAAPVGVTAFSTVTSAVLPLPPSGNPVPQILGSVAQGQTLTEAHGAWSNNPTSFSYQWQRCDAAGNNCAAIPGETNQTYSVSPIDVGHALRVLESAKNAGGTVGPVSSAATAPVAATASFTSLYAVPTTPVTNQAVTLVATVLSPSSATADRPAGTITFENNGHPIGGCTNQTVAPTDQSVVVSCQTSFAGGTSPERLTAVFKPSAGANIGGSTGPSGKPFSLNVGRDSTTLGLQVSNPTVNAGSSATYVATVTPAHTGPAHPSGSVVFLDGGKPITGCTSRPVTKSGAFFSATCTVTYKTDGKHSITARYGGDGGFSGSSSSPPQLVNVHTPPGHCCVKTPLHWTFFFSPSYTKVLALIVSNVPRGATVIVGCHGRGCPFKTTSIAVKATLCKAKNKRKCPVARPVTMQLVGRFHGRHLGLGTVIIVQIVEPGWIGKYVSFTIRPRHAPNTKISCLAPGSSRPGYHC